MTEPPIPPDEAKRQRALDALDILDTAPEERFDRLTRIACRSFGVPIALVSLVDSDRQWFKSRQGLDATETPRAMSFCGHAILENEIFEVPDTREDERFADNPLVQSDPHIRFYAGAPIAAQDGSQVGTLCLIDREPRTLDEDDRALLNDLARLVEEDLANCARATTDMLTGLSNRRGFIELSERALSLCKRVDRPASLLFIDLDGFKPINDTFGHAEGDRALVGVAEILLETFRESDVIGRVGGDEFCVLLTDATDPKVPMLRLESCLSAWTAERPYVLGCSVGLVEFAPERHLTLADLMREADERMYVRKRARAQDSNPRD